MVMQNPHLFILCAVPSPFTLLFFFFQFRIKERKHQADLAKLEDKREGEQIQLSNQLYQLEIQKEREKEEKKKVERRRQHHVSNGKSEFKMLVSPWLPGVKLLHLAYK